MPQLTAKLGDVTVDERLEAFKHLVHVDKVVFVAVNGLENVVRFFDGDCNIVFFGSSLFSNYRTYGFILQIFFHNNNQIIEVENKESF